MCPKFRRQDVLARFGHEILISKIQKIKTSVRHRDSQWRVVGGFFTPLTKLLAFVLAKLVIRGGIYSTPFLLQQHRRSVVGLSFSYYCPSYFLGHKIHREHVCAVYLLSLLIMISILIIISSPYSTSTIHFMNWY